MPISVEDLNLPLRGAPGWDVGVRAALELLTDSVNAQEVATDDAIAVISGAVDANDATIAAAGESGPATRGVFVDQERTGIVLPTSITYSDLQAAADSAATFGTRLWAAGEVTTDQTLIVQCDADLSGLTYNYTGTGVAVQLGSTTGVIFRKSIRAPKVINANKSGAGWASVAGSVGIKAVNLNSCAVVEIPYVFNFETGLLVYGEAQGNSYNTYLLGHLENNQVNLRLDASATGWSNQNTYVGGRFAHNSSEGTDAAGARHIRLEVVPNPVNNNVWLNPSVEGLTAEQQIDADGGTYNIWINPRLERSGGGRIRWGATASQNQIIGGYQAGTALVTRVSGEQGNTIRASNKYEIYGSSTVGVQRLQNRTSDTAPAVTVYPSGSLADSEWRWRWSAHELAGKRAAESFARCILDGNNGRIYLGTGTVTPAFYFGAVGTSGVALTGGNFYFTTDNANDIGLASSLRPRYVRAGTAVVTGAVATGSRPAAATAGAGASVFDTTLGKPIWSTGSGWVDATGATV